MSGREHSSRDDEEEKKWRKKNVFKHNKQQHKKIIHLPYTSLWCGDGIYNTLNTRPNRTRYHCQSQAKGRDMCACTRERVAVAQRTTTIGLFGFLLSRIFVVILPSSSSTSQSLAALPMIGTQTKGKHWDRREFSTATAAERRKTGKKSSRRLHRRIDGPDEMFPWDMKNVSYSTPQKKRRGAERKRRKSLMSSC